MVVCVRRGQLNFLGIRKASSSAQDVRRKGTMPGKDDTSASLDRGQCIRRKHFESNEKRAETDADSPFIRKHNKEMLY